MTAVEWMFEKLWDTPKDKFAWHAILEEAKQMVTNDNQLTDEEILKEAINHSELYENKFAARNAFIIGCKWYREQLKQRQ